MPAQKRNSSSSANDGDSGAGESLHRRKRSRHELEEEEEGNEDEQEQLGEAEEDSDGSRSSDDVANLSEWILVELPALRTYVQCPICLGIIKNTRTVMECLHRFCRECIDKSMRLGNNECPACRTHCASRRSLRDDPRFDDLIEIIYEDIERYEEEELAFHEEEENRNKQIQESIAQVFQRQSEALDTRRKKRKDKALFHKYRDSYPRRKRRKNTRGTLHEVSDDKEDENNSEQNKSSSEDERATEVKPRRYKRRARGQSLQPSPSITNADFVGIGNDLEASRGSKDISCSPIWTSEMLAWGGGAARSRSVRNSRTMRLTKYLDSQKEKNVELYTHLMLTSLDKQRNPTLQQLYLCCPSHFSVECLKEYVAQETLLPTEDIEILLVKEHPSCNALPYTLDVSALTEKENALQVLDGKETLSGVREIRTLQQNHMILAYRRREKS